jgi:large subunit ribosomal protein L1
MSIKPTKKYPKKYSANLEIVRAELTKKPNGLSPLEASKLLFSLKPSKFKEGETVELHLKLNIDTTKSDQLVRGNVVLPNGSGKKVIVAAFVTSQNEAIAKKAGADIIGADELIEKIKNSGKVDFDVAIAEPEVMKKLAVIGKILGIAGVMPNPKTGTVGTNVEEMILSLKSGRVDFKNDKTGNLHIIAGKLNSDFNPEKVAENIKAIVAGVEKLKPEVIKKKYILSVHLTSTHSPSVKVDLSVD